MRSRVVVEVVLGLAVQVLASEAEQRSSWDVMGLYLTEYPMTLPRAISWPSAAQLSVAVVVLVRTALVTLGPRVGTAEL